MFRRSTGAFSRKWTCAAAVLAMAAASVIFAVALLQQSAIGEKLSGSNDSAREFARATELFRDRALDQAIALLESIVNRDPNFAPAWAMLATAYTANATTGDPATQFGNDAAPAHRAYSVWRNKSEHAAREALRLDPDSGQTYAQLAVYRAEDGQWIAADDLDRKAIALAPENPDVLDRHRRFLAYTGKVKEALKTSERLRRFAPNTAIYNQISAEILLADGQPDAALNALGNAGKLPSLRLAQIYAAQGHYQFAADTLMAMPQRDLPFPAQTMTDAARLLRSAPARPTAGEQLPELGNFWFVYAYLGAFDRAVRSEEAAWAIPRVGSFVDFWTPELGPLRMTSAFKALVRKMGLVDYWRARGWPDLCHPVTAEDFKCN